MSHRLSAGDILHLENLALKHGDRQAIQSLVAELRWSLKLIGVLREMLDDSPVSVSASRILRALGVVDVPRNDGES